jgi:hypothetical protein
MSAVRARLARVMVWGVVDSERGGEYRAGAGEKSKDG